MINLILAAETTSSPPGDDFQTLAYILLGITLLVTAIATAIVSPSADKH